MPAGVVQQVAPHAVGLEAFATRVPSQAVELQGHIRRWIGEVEPVGLPADEHLVLRDRSREAVLDEEPSQADLPPALGVSVALIDEPPQGAASLPAGLAELVDGASKLIR